MARDRDPLGPSRQKSCNACVKGKRRCNKALPACSRCVKQRYLCIYGGQTDFSFRNSADDPISQECFANPAPMTGVDLFMPGPDVFSLPFATNTEMTPSATVRFPLDSRADDLVASVPQYDAFWQAESSTMPPGKSLIRKDYTKMGLVCLADASTKVAFTMATFKKVHVNFAQTNGTRFIHRHLYKDDTPRWMYWIFFFFFYHSNPDKPIDTDKIPDALQDLKSTASSTSSTPQQKLARVHALVFYQLIRMFDGDVTLGQQADDDFSLLEAWNRDLYNLRDNLDDLIKLDRKSLREYRVESWEICVFSPIDEMGKWVDTPRWTLSSHLWNADNSFDFFRAWKEQPFYLIDTFKFDEFLETGTGDDLDDFALYFLTVGDLLFWKSATGWEDELSGPFALNFATARYTAVGKQ
ncbi:hypothetical protein GGR57DRAFT_502056 [Xylariaceae sp. FL1272]|nr:hypothetical protein GGR57DRAFT_502056 [Xylariaceae sp. FL1272]